MTEVITEDIIGMTRVEFTVDITEIEIIVTPKPLSSITNIREGVKAVFYKDDKWKPEVTKQYNGQGYITSCDNAFMLDIKEFDGMKFAKEDFVYEPSFPGPFDYRPRRMRYVGSEKLEGYYYDSFISIFEFLNGNPQDY